jgi:hypothetical protein
VCSVCVCVCGVGLYCVALCCVALCYVALDSTEKCCAILFCIALTNRLVDYTQHPYQSTNIPTTYPSQYDMKIENNNRKMEIIVKQIIRLSRLPTFLLLNF